MKVLLVLIMAIPATEQLPDKIEFIPLTNLHIIGIDLYFLILHTLYAITLSVLISKKVNWF